MLKRLVDICHSIQQRTEDVIYIIEVCLGAFFIALVHLMALALVILFLIWFVG